MYKIIFSKQAEKDAVNIERSGYKPKVVEIVRTVRVTPHEISQGFERLKGDLDGFCSRRINLQHRFVYQVLPNTGDLRDENDELYEGIVQILRMWSHYE